MKTILTILFIYFKSNKSTFIMRKIKLLTLLFVSILFFGLFSASSAQVIEGSVYLTTQEEVNAFTGISITDSLTISGSDIVDLSALSTLTSVGGRLSVRDNDALSNLAGLSNLTSVGGDLRIYENDLLNNLDGLSNLVIIASA